MLEEICSNDKILSRKQKSDGLLLFKRSQKNLVPPDASYSLKPKSYKAVVEKAVDRFSNQTTIHGMERWCSMSYDKKERFLWLLIFLAALLGCIYVSSIISSQNSNRTFRTLIDQTKYPTFKIPFPEVVICNQQRLNWQRLKSAQRRFLQRAHRTAEFQALFQRILSAYDELTFGTFNRFEMLNKESQSQLAELNYINFSNVVDFMSWRCNEIFEGCSWRYHPVDCCDIFVKRRSQQGQCLGFNTVEGEVGALMKRMDPWWPRHTGAYGPSSGLKLTVKLRDEWKRPKEKNESNIVGITLMLTQPDTYFNDPIEIARDTETTVNIEAVMHFYDDYTRIIPSSERDCVFPDEENSADFKSLLGHKYMLENCHSECQQEYLIKFCNCTMDLLFPPGQYPVCKLLDLPCLARYNYRLLYMKQYGEDDYVTPLNTSLTCRCLMNCYSLTYFYDVRSAKLSQQYSGNISSSAVVELDIYFLLDVLMVYKTSLYYTWVDLVVSFGGIIALFLGCSLVSLVELAYFQLVELPRSLLQYRRQLRKIQNANFPTRY